MPFRGKYEPLDTLCGDILPKPIMSNGPLMLFELRGRYSGKGNRRFKAEYSFVKSKCLLFNLNFEIGSYL